MNLEEMQAKHPPANQAEYDRAKPTAILAGEMAGLVYDIRERAGLTQTELARRMGTTQSSIARIESGASLPGLDMLGRLARATGTPVHLTVPGVADIEVGNPVVGGRHQPGHVTTSQLPRRRAC